MPNKPHALRRELVEALGLSDGDAIHLWEDLLASVRSLVKIADASVSGLDKPEGEYFNPWALRVTEARVERLRELEQQLVQTEAEVERLRKLHTWAIAAAGRDADELDEECDDVDRWRDEVERLVGEADILRRQLSGTDDLLRQAKLAANDVHCLLYTDHDITALQDKHAKVMELLVLMLMRRNISCLGAEVGAGNEGRALPTDNPEINEELRQALAPLKGQVITPDIKALARHKILRLTDP